MVFEARMKKVYGNWEEWFVYVNGKKVLGPFASEALAETKIKACMQAWFHSAKRKGA